MSAEMAFEIAQDPGMRAVAPTMPYDFAIMGHTDTGVVIPVELVRTLNIPTLVLLDGASPEFFGAAATRLADLLPDARLTVLDGRGHGAAAEFVVPPVAAFLS